MIRINNASKYNRTVAVFLLFVFFYDNVSAIRCIYVDENDIFDCKVLWVLGKGEWTSVGFFVL